MRFIVYGAGAIGGVIGWSLQDAGHEVVLVARGPHLAAMQADGLRLAWPEGSGTLPVTAVGDPADIDWRDSDVVVVVVHVDVQDDRDVVPKAWVPFCGRLGACASSETVPVPSGA